MKAFLAWINRAFLFTCDRETVSEVNDGWDHFNFRSEEGWTVILAIPFIAHFWMNIFLANKIQNIHLMFPLAVIAVSLVSPLCVAFSLPNTHTIGIIKFCVIRKDGDFCNCVLVVQHRKLLLLYWHIMHEVFRYYPKVAVHPSLHPDGWYILSTEFCIQAHLWALCWEAQIVVSW